MKLYSDFGRRRTWQIVGDVVAIVVLVGGIVVASTIHGAIAAFAAVGIDVERSGTEFESNMAEIGDSLASVPLIGAGIGAPFEAASGAGRTLAAAGESWQRGVETLAAITGWTIAVLVVVLIVLGWVVPRARGAVRRTAAARFAASPSSLDLLAFRALASRPISDVADIDAAAGAAWRRGDPAVIRRLAALELKASGVRLAGG